MKELEDEPILTDEEQFLYEVFFDMQRDRPVTFGALLPFPTMIIEQWGARLSLGPMAYFDFEHVIKALDTAWLAEVRKAPAAPTPPA